MCTRHMVWDPPPALSHVGYGEKAVERVERSEERGRREEKEGWEEAFYKVTSHVPSQNGWPFALSFFVCSTLLFTQ